MRGGLAIAALLALAACAAPAARNDAAAPAKVGIPTGETGGMCGGVAAFQCLNDADYCAFPEGECVQIADGAGSCAPKPEICTMDYNPVCGCDGETYGNACAAAAAGVSVAAKGECAAKAQ